MCGGEHFLLKFSITDNLTEARNSSMLKQARIDMLDGIWPLECKRCEDEEDAGIRSRMQYENER
ncbi:MAG: hypothetical protein QF619_07770, partial [Candidatus Binatia bacterium]|nr:hypothetical protein [Candidatus Binatia bacterium]